MTDKEINIALAQACGWQPSGKYAVMHGQYQVFRQILTCNKDGTLRKFDYRDPVIFAAICKHWGLVVNFHKSRVDCFVDKNEFSQLAYRHEANTSSMEKATAMVIIEYEKRQSMLDVLAKRGVK